MCQMHRKSDVQLWNWFLTINSDSTHQEWMNFVFIVTGSIFLHSYWVSDIVDFKSSSGLLWRSGNNKLRKFDFCVPAQTEPFYWPLISMSFKINGWENSNVHNFLSDLHNIPSKFLKSLAALYFWIFILLHHSRAVCENYAILWAWRNTRNRSCVRLTWDMSFHFTLSQQFLYSIGFFWSLIHRHWALTNFKLRQLVVLDLN